MAIPNPYRSVVSDLVDSCYVPVIESRWSREMDKPHADTDECLLLILLKRKNAKEALRRILMEFALPPHHNPSVVVVLEYLTNMVYYVELTLKLLSGEWKSHDVAGMYQTVFKQPHPDPDLMAEIKTALRDQKYLFEPNGGLLAKVEGLENLGDELMDKVRERHPVYNVQTDIPAPASFLPYLRANIHRFYTKKGPTVGFSSLAQINIPAIANMLVPTMESEIRAMEAFIDEFIRNNAELGFHQGEIWRI